MKDVNGMVEKQNTQREKKKMAAHNKRRKNLGVHVHFWGNDSSSFFEDLDTRSKRRPSSTPLEMFIGNVHLERSERWKLLRRSKSFLARRSFDAESVDALSPFYKKVLSKNRNPSVLDFFPALKYSYCASLPARVIEKKRSISVGKGAEVGYFDICCAPDGSSHKARVDDISRSHSIRLDPVDSPKQLFIYRKRIQKCLSWAYCNGIAPIMMTLTVFHRWHPLKGLLNVLKKAWNYFFTGTRAAVKRSKRMGLQGYIRRAEETINNGVLREDGTPGYNSGWHPHYHVILFVPVSNLSVVSDMENELRDAWFNAVNRYFEEEFGEPIDPSYSEAFRLHGLSFSRGAPSKEFKRHTLPRVLFNASELGEDVGVLASSFSDALRSQATVSSVSSAVVDGDDDEDDWVEEEPLRLVDDSEYMGKILGCSSEKVYCGDKEVSSMEVKSSRIPFDLLCEDTAENVDLWVEYALATKGVMSFFFARGFEKRVNDYFASHPDKNPVKDFVRSDKVVAQLNINVYRFFYKCFKLDELLKVAAKGYEPLVAWCRKFYLESGFFEENITEEMLPLPPNSRYQFSRPPVVFSFDEVGDLLVNGEAVVFGDSFDEGLFPGHDFSLDEVDELFARSGVSTCHYPPVSMVSDDDGCVDEDEVNISPVVDNLSEVNISSVSELEIEGEASESLACGGASCAGDDGVEHVKSSHGTQSTGNDDDGLGFLRDACDQMIAAGKDINFDDVKAILAALKPEPPPPGPSALELLEAARREIMEEERARAQMVADGNDFGSVGNVANVTPAAPPDERFSKSAQFAPVTSSETNDQPSKNLFMDKEFMFRERAKEVVSSPWYPDWYKKRFEVFLKDNLIIPFGF